MEIDFDFVMTCNRPTHHMIQCLNGNFFHRIQGKQIFPAMSFYIGVIGLTTSLRNLMFEKNIFDGHNLTQMGIN